MKEIKKKRKKYSEYNNICLFVFKFWDKLTPINNEILVQYDDQTKMSERCFHNLVPTNNIKLNMRAYFLLHDQQSLSITHQTYSKQWKTSCFHDILISRQIWQLSLSDWRSREKFCRQRRIIMNPFARLSAWYNITMDYLVKNCVIMKSSFEWVIIAWCTTFYFVCLTYYYYHDIIAVESDGCDS